MFISVGLSRKPGHLFKFKKALAAHHENDQKALAIIHESDNHQKPNTSSGGKSKHTKVQKNKCISVYLYFLYFANSVLVDSHMLTFVLYCLFILNLYDLNKMKFAVKLCAG